MVSTTDYIDYKDYTDCIDYTERTERAVALRSDRRLVFRELYFNISSR